MTNAKTSARLYESGCLGLNLEGFNQVKSKSAIGLSAVEEDADSKVSRQTF